MQLALFEVPTTLPVQLHENFLSSAEADALLTGLTQLAQAIAYGTLAE